MFVGQFEFATNSTAYYYISVIQSYRDKDSQAIAERQRVTKLSENIQRRAQRKLMMLNKALSINDLQMPPINRQEALFGNWAGQHSIRIDDPWRICFVSNDSNAYQVKIVDYH